MFTLVLLIHSWITIMTTVVSTTPHQQEKEKPVNPHNFRYRVNNPDLCTTRGTDVLIWIHSSADHFRNRIFIRNTWGNPKNFENHHKVSLVFFLGMSSNKSVQVAIEYESEIYQDIVQETFLDSYQNLTYKALMGCKWTAKYCESADFIIKTDDDAFVDTTSLFRIISELRAENRFLSNTLLCRVWSESGVKRNGKWGISIEEYKEKLYPPYCSGLGLVMTADLPLRMYKASLYEPFFWIDDVYLTGFLAKTLNTTFVNLDDRYYIGSSMAGTNQTKSFDYFIFYHVAELERHKIDMLWSKFIDLE